MDNTLNWYCGRCNTWTDRTAAQQAQHYITVHHDNQAEVERLLGRLEGES